MTEQAESGSQANDGRLTEAWIEANVPDGFTMVAVGDLVVDDVLAPLLESQSPEMMAILKGSDITFGNFEGNAIDLEKFGGWPDADPGGSWLISSPRVPADLRSMGFDLVARANNHTTDWGVAGMRYTDRLLTEAGIGHAGTGETLAAARAPEFLTVPAGRVSLVAAASRFQTGSRASDAAGRIPARPGLNALRTTRHAVVTAAELETLKVIRDAQPAGSIRRSILDADERNGTVTLFGAKYVAASAETPRGDFVFTVNPQDRRDILQNMKQGKQTSDFAISSLHTHEPGNYSETPPTFMQDIARDFIDHGADAFIGHGPHQLRGIEIYKGKPIFYSLGNFIFMENTQQPLLPEAFEKAHLDPADTTAAEALEHKRVHGVFKESVWYESVIAVSTFAGNGSLRSVRLHPIELHYASGRDADRGIPRLAQGSSARRILERLQRLSEPYGTAIDIHHETGIIRVDRAR
ncbi:CapA family protein [Arthrobacter sp. R3-55]